MEFSNVAFYASSPSPLFDTFDFHYGKVWKMKVNEEEVIRGNFLNKLIQVMGIIICFLLTYLFFKFIYSR